MASASDRPPFHLSRGVRDVLPPVLLMGLGLLQFFMGGPDQPRWVGLPVLAAATASLTVRRRAPLTVLVVNLAALLLGVEIDPKNGLVAGPISVALAGFTVGHQLEAAKVLIGIGLIATTFLIGFLMEPGGLSDIVFVVILFGGPVAFGQALRLRDRRLVAVTVQAERLEREVERREREAVEAERGRIARELHDIVSHSLSVVVIQTQAIRRRLGPEQARERDDLSGVEVTARQAMAEMRRLFGVLRAKGDPPSLEPQPGIGQIDGLAEQSRAGGLDVEVRVEGAGVPVPPGVDLAAFRIVQEALTNVRKHAGQVRASVGLRFGERELEVLIENEGGTASVNGSSGGHGLVGMRERIMLYGGSLEAGPRPEGGFRVKATLPMKG